MPFVDPFGEQSGGGSPPTTAPRPDAPVSGGGFVDPFASGGGAPAQTAVAATPAHHGGGLFGFLGGNVVKGAIGGLENLVVHQAPTTLHNSADIAMGLIHGGVPEHLRPQVGEGFEAYLARTQPAAGAVLAAPEGLGHDVAHPATIARNPAQAGLDLLGTAALVAGPVAGRLGGASAEAAASAAEAGQYATAVEGAAARGVASETAAQAARQAAEEAAVRAARLGRLSAIADPSRAAINRGANLPFLPVELAGKALGAVARPLADAASATKLGGYVADVSTRMGARAAADRLVQAPSLGVRREAGLNTRAAARAVGRDADHEQAVNLIQTGTVPALRSVLAAAEHSPEASTAALDRLGVTPRAAEIATGYTDGTLAPKDTAAMDKALGIRGAAVARRAEQYGEAAGNKIVAQAKLGGASDAQAEAIRSAIARSREEQFGNQPMQGAIEARLAPLQEKVGGLERPLAEAQSRATLARGRADAAKTAAAVPPEALRPFEDAVAKVHAATERARAAQGLAGTAEERAIAQGQNTAALEAEVRAGRAGIKKGIKATRDSLMARVESALAAGGGLISKRDYLSSAPPGAEAFGAGLYDVLDEMTPTERSLLYKGGRFTPDVWAANVAHALGLPVDMAPEEVLQHVIDIRRAAVEYGRALQPGALTETISGVASRMATSTEEADYIDRILTGTPAEAARTLASEEHPAIVNALYDRVSAALEGRTSPAKLDEPARALYDAERAEFSRVSATQGLDAARAKLLDRIGSKAQAAGVRLGKATERATVAERQATKLEHLHGKLSDQVSAERVRLGGEAAAQAEYDRASQAASEAAGTPQAEQASIARDIARSRLLDAQGKGSATEVAPARFRPAIVVGQRVQSVLHEYATTLAKDNPEAAAHLRQLADETPATLEALNAAGVDPQHLIGELADTGRRMSGGRAGAPVRVRGTGEEKQKLGGSIPARLADAARLEANRGVQVVRNLAAPRLQAMFGKTAADVLGDTADLSGEQLASAMYAERERWVPWDPSRGRPGVPGRIGDAEITARTTFIPEQAAKVFDGYWQGNPKGPLAKFVDWTSRGDKGLRLALNPSIHAAYMVGNLVMELPAVGPKLIPNLFRAAQLLREEARTGEAKVPARLMGATFGGVERAELEAGKAGGRFGGFRTPLGLAESKGYALMDLSDRVQRVATYLTKKGEGFTDEAAVRQALAVNGDFSSLSPFEQNVVKRVFPGYAWCVDPSTETLTKRGWVTGDELTTDDEILSMEPMSGELRWSAVKSIYRGHYEGEMFRLCSQQIDALVTPGHKFALTDGRLLPVEELRQRHAIRIMGSGVEGPSVYSDAFVEVVGWAVTEGHYKRNAAGNITTVEIYQNPGPKADRIALALKRSGARWHEGMNRTCRYWGVTGDIARAILAVAPGRVMTSEFILSLSQDQRLLLLDTMIAADGSQAQRGRQDCRVFAQKDKRAVDAFVMVASLAGVPTYARRLVTTRPILGRPTAPSHIWHVTLRTRTTAQVRNLKGQQRTGHAPYTNTLPTEPYSGQVWCPETEYGTFVCRRNGIVYVTGNTRHITQLALRLPIEHPLRVAWMLSLAQNDNTGGNVPWWMNPFESALRVGQLHPLIRGVLAAKGEKASGLDVTAISHSAALGPKNKPVNLLKHPAQLAYALERFEPQGKLEQALRLAPVRRYGTGEPVVTTQGRMIAQPGGKLGAVKAAAGFGSYSPTASSQKAQARTDRSNARAALSYQRRLAAARKRAPVKG